MGDLHGTVVISIVGIVTCFLLMQKYNTRKGRRNPLQGVDLQLAHFEENRTYLICISLNIKTKNSNFNEKKRHIRIRHNSIKQFLSHGVISLDFVRSKKNIADPFTKQACH